MKRTYEHSRRVQLDLDEKYAEITRRLDRDQETAETQYERLNTNIIKQRRETNEGQGSVKD